MGEKSVFWFIYYMVIVVSVYSLAEESEKLPWSDAVKDEVEDKNITTGEINDTLLGKFNDTENEGSVLDVNETISVNSSQIQVNSSQIENTTKENVIKLNSSLPKWFCKGRNNSQSNDSIEQRVIIVNADELLRRINTSVDNETDSCAVVLFYTQYCPFSAKLAPLYNALGRVYNELPILAVDAYKQHSLNTRFGVVAVPAILLFHSGKPVLKFNNSGTLDDMRNFIKNNTGVEGNYSVQISEEDHTGPLRNKPVEEKDHYLLFSVLFLVSFGAFMFSKSSYRQLLWNRIQAIQWQRLLQWFSREKQD